jgi:predicted transcriptional regulator
MCKILLSINPEHVEKILDGTKLYEFRKVRCREKITKIVIYSTSPIMKVVGEAAVDDVIESSPEEVWRIASDTAGIDKTFFDDYYLGRKRAVAFRIGQTTKYKEPKDLSEYGLSWAPQSFAYLNE